MLTAIKNKTNPLLKSTLLQWILSKMFDSNQKCPRVLKSVQIWVDSIKNFDGFHHFQQISWFSMAFNHCWSFNQYFKGKWSKSIKNWLLLIRFYSESDKFNQKLFKINRKLISSFNQSLNLLADFKLDRILMLNSSSDFELNVPIQLFWLNACVKRA